ncbi:MAG: hypothetical protein HYR85_24010 [Planctomycetes bacterium]|nr:hypothetical protein [Planctomycetota bacterium]MBI3846738.1 hypothetical protein [Planctomycetota bacterium]
MEDGIVVRGRLADPRHIELERAITEICGQVEVVIRPVADTKRRPGKDVFDVIAALPPGTLQKEEIDLQVREERDSWDDR